MQGWGIVLAAIVYLLFLFVVASYGDRKRNRVGRLNRKTGSRPGIYALSLAIYCTSWTFFGSIGLATRSGLDFLAIYLGPLLMITVGYKLFSHIVTVAKRERITSIADFIAARYGKSAAVGAFAAIIAVVGTVPYIALQLKAISSTVDTMIAHVQPGVFGAAEAPVDTSFFVSLILALFAILFGTRHTDATEHQDGLMLAIATESIVKLVAFLIGGLFVTFYLFGGVGDLIAKAQASPFVMSNFIVGIHPSTFVVFTLLSFCAFVLLPRQFHVGVVENHSQREILAARWMFPLYLLLINLFVLPVAVAGMLSFGSSVEPDNYFLALPLENDAWIVSFVVFVGGLSAATAMVIVACVALAIMTSNNLVLPLLLRLQSDNQAERNRRLPKDMSDRLLTIRRTAIFVILGLAYAYFQAAGDSTALAAIGLLSFAAIAQFAPAFFIGLFWKRPTALGAFWGMGAGFATWFYTLFLPTLLPDTSSLLINGPGNISWLQPHALFGVDANPINHGVLFSLLANTIVFLSVSLLRKPRPIEQMQASIFSIQGRDGDRVLVRDGRKISISELQHSVANYLGKERCDRAFARYFKSRSVTPDDRDTADDEVVSYAEQLLASAIGAASARLVISLLLEKHGPVEENTIRLLGDASEALQYNRDLLQTALDQVEQGISVFDREFRLSSWNRQFRTLLDLPLEFGQAGTALTVVAEAIAKNIETPLSTSLDLTTMLLETGKIYSITMLSSQRVIEIQTNTVPDGGIVISWNDTTARTRAAAAMTTANETLEKRVQERTEELTRLNEDLARAREAAEEANIGKTKFLAAVGHDILQPLNAARLYTSSLVEVLDNTSTKKLAGNVDDALESVEDILGAVLAISRLDAGVLTPNVTTFAIERMFRRLEVEFRPIAQSKGLALNIISNNLSVKSDYGLLRRLLQNLVSNAIKYTKSGTVTLDARVKRNFVIFEVRDTGEGIRAEDREVIFQEFRRLESGKLAAPGLGLGLSIVQRLATTLGHVLDFETAPGKGSVFKVSVPLAIGETADVNQTDIAVVPKYDVSDLQVVCIDNDRAILDGMKVLLSRWGCTVHTFGSSVPMLDAVVQLKPDIILADYHLDNENGLDVISTVRAKLKREIPSVLITADRSAGVRTSAEAINITVMNKPLKPAGLRALLDRIAKQRSNKPSVAAE